MGRDGKTRVGKGEKGNGGGKGKGKTGGTEQGMGWGRERRKGGKGRRGATAPPTLIPGAATGHDRTQTNTCR